MACLSWLSHQPRQCCSRRLTIQISSCQQALTHSWLLSLQITGVHTRLLYTAAGSALTCGTSWLLAGCSVAQPAPQQSCSPAPCSTATNAAHAKSTPVGSTVLCGRCLNLHAAAMQHSTDQLPAAEQMQQSTDAAHQNWPQEAVE